MSIVFYSPDGMPYHHRFGYAKGLWAFHRSFLYLQNNKNYYAQIKIPRNIPGDLNN